MRRHLKLWLALGSVVVPCVAAAACGNPTTGAPGFGQSTQNNLPSASGTSGATGGSGNPAQGGGSGVNSSTSNSSGGMTQGQGSGGSGGSSSGGGAHGTGDAGAPKGSGDASVGNSPQADSGTTMVTPHMGNTCLKPATGDYSQAGPYTVMQQANVDLATYLPSGTATPTTYTIFYPQPFETNCPHPVVAWGNGTTVTGSQTYAFYNQNAASYGIVVIASDNSNVGSGQYHKAAIDYMMAQNADSTSMFYQKLSTRVGTSGHSQGGIGATAATTLIGPNCQAEVCVAGAGQPQKGTAFICLTGTADMAEQGCTSTFSAAGPQAFLADWDGGDHVTTETIAGYIQMQPGSIQMMRLYAAWFRCFLADDQVACKMFEGGAPNNCGICQDPGWAILKSTGL
jgi:hypothetical protein